MDKLTNVRKIESIPMGGCNKHDYAVIVCTHKGDMPMISMDGTSIVATAYFSKEVDGTIISPTTLVRQHLQTYSGWVQHSDCDSNTGTITLLGKHGNDNIVFKVFCKNNLWYHSANSINTQSLPRINKISNAAKYELWHQRTAHAGESVLQNLHKHVVGVTKLHGNVFYKCHSCLSGKLSTKRRFGKPRHSTKRVKESTPPQDQDGAEDIIDHITMKTNPGQHFHIDFSFIRGSDFDYKNERGHTITSIDGKNSYVAIIDRATRYTWVFTPSSKQPPVDIIRKILEKLKSKHKHRTVRVDQGGKLGRSADFSAMVDECGFALETTGSDASAQN